MERKAKPVAESRKELDNESDIKILNEAEKRVVEMTRDGSVGKLTTLGAWQTATEWINRELSDSSRSKDISNKLAKRLAQNAFDGDIKVARQNGTATPEYIRQLQLKAKRNPILKASGVSYLPGGALEDENTISMKDIGVDVSAPGQPKKEEKSETPKEAGFDQGLEDFKKGFQEKNAGLPDLEYKQKFLADLGDFLRDNNVPNEKAMPLILKAGDDYSRATNERRLKEEALEAKKTTVAPPETNLLDVSGPEVEPAVESATEENDRFDKWLDDQKAEKEPGEGVKLENMSKTTVAVPETDFGGLEAQWDSAEVPPVEKMTGADWERVLDEPTPPPPPPPERASVPPVSEPEPEFEPVGVMPDADFGKPKNKGPEVIHDVDTEASAENAENIGEKLAGINEKTDERAKGLGEKFHEQVRWMAESYRKLPLKQKVGISVLLYGSGAAGAAIGGIPGLALVGGATLGKGIKSLFTTAATFVAVEGGIRSSFEKTTGGEVRGWREKLAIGSAGAFAVMTGAGWTGEALKQGASWLSEYTSSLWGGDENVAMYGSKMLRDVTKPHLGEFASDAEREALVAKGLVPEKVFLGNIPPNNLVSEKGYVPADFLAKVPVEGDGKEFLDNATNKFVAEKVYAFKDLESTFNSLPLAERPAFLLAQVDAVKKEIVPLLNAPNNLKALSELQAKSDLLEKLQGELSSGGAVKEVAKAVSAGAVPSPLGEVPDTVHTSDALLADKEVPLGKTLDAATSAGEKASEVADTPNPYRENLQKILDNDKHLPTGEVVYDDNGEVLARVERPGGIIPEGERVAPRFRGMEEALRNARAGAEEAAGNAEEYDASASDVEVVKAGGSQLSESALEAKEAKVNSIFSRLGGSIEGITTKGWEDVRGLNANQVAVFNEQRRWFFSPTNTAKAARLVRSLIAEQGVRPNAGETVEAFVDRVYQNASQ